MELLVKIAGREIIIPDTIVNMWIVVILLSIFALIVNNKIKKEIGRASCRERV